MARVQARCPEDLKNSKAGTSFGADQPSKPDFGQKRASKRAKAILWVSVRSETRTPKFERFWTSGGFAPEILVNMDMGEEGCVISRYES